MEVQRGVIRRAIGELSVKWQVTGLGVALTVLVVVLPALAIAVAVFVAARWSGWPSSKMRNLAAVVWVASLAGAAMQFGFGGTAETLAELETAAQAALSGQVSWTANIGRATLIELPIGVTLAWVLLRRQEVNMSTSTKPKVAARWRRRTLKNRRSAAIRRSKRELTPMSRKNGDAVLGQLYRVEKPHEALIGEYFRTRHPVYLRVSDKMLNQMMTLVGRTGAGKTELLKRLTAGWTEARWSMYGQQSDQPLSGPVAGRREDTASPRPLTIMVDCKGGEPAFDLGIEWIETMEAIGLAPERLGLFPLETQLDMWRLPAGQLVEVIHELAKTEHKFYDTMQRGLLRLVLEAPGMAPPATSAEFLTRIDPERLRIAWRGQPQRLTELDQMVKSGTLVTDLMLFDDLFSSLTMDFDGGRSMQDFDALFITLPGTSKNREACVKAKLLVEMLKYELAHGRKREVLFVFDEWSAVSELVNVQQLLQTARSLGGRVLLAAQSRSTLGTSPQDVERLLGVMGGGHLVMAGNEVEDWSKLGGTRQRAEVGAQLMGEDHTGMGTMRMQDSYTLAPDDLRQLPERDVVLVGGPETPGEVQFATVVKLDATKRLPSSAIAKHPARQIPTGDNKMPVWAVPQARQQAIQHVMPKLTAGPSSKDRG